MNASATWKPSETNTQQYDAVSQSKHTIALDASPQHTNGPSPMELVLMGLCACTSVDVVSILHKKREPLAGLTVAATAQQAPTPPQVFTHIVLEYRISGNVSHKAAEDAIHLSKSKYCSVSQMLEKSAVIEHVIEYVHQQAPVAE